MRDRRVSELVVSSKLLPITANNQSGLVSNQMAVAIALEFEYPLGWDGLAAAANCTGNDKFPDFVEFEGREFFFDGTAPVGCVW